MRLLALLMPIDSYLVVCRGQEIQNTPYNEIWMAYRIVFEEIVCLDQIQKFLVAQDKIRGIGIR